MGKMKIVENWRVLKFFRKQIHQNDKIRAANEPLDRHKSTVAAMPYGRTWNKKCTLAKLFCSIQSHKNFVRMKKPPKSQIATGRKRRFFQYRYEQIYVN